MTQRFDTPIWCLHQACMIQIYTLKDRSNYVRFITWLRWEFIWYLYAIRLFFHFKFMTSGTYMVDGITEEYVLSEYKSIANIYRKRGLSSINYS